MFAAGRSQLCPSPRGPIGTAKTKAPMNLLQKVQLNSVRTGTCLRAEVKQIGHNMFLPTWLLDQVGFVPLLVLGQWFFQY